MTDLVTCNSCGTQFSVKTAGIRTVRSGDYEVQYFTCPGCHRRYQILTTDTELREGIRQREQINEKISLGQAKHFRPKTMNKYWNEANDMDEKLKKMRNDLREKGKEILEKLGKE